MARHPQVIHAVKTAKKSMSVSGLVPTILLPVPVDKTSSPSPKTRELNLDSASKLQEQVTGKDFASRITDFRQEYNIWREEGFSKKALN